MDSDRWQAPRSRCIGTYSGKTETKSIPFSPDSRELQSFLKDEENSQKSFFQMNRRKKAEESFCKRRKKRIREDVPIYEHTSKSCLACIRNTTKFILADQREYLLVLLKENFDCANFRNGQIEAIEAILSGESTIAVLPTGSGKSLCYQLPLLTLRLFHGINAFCLVISPLISLMEDQLASLPATLKGMILARSTAKFSTVTMAIANGNLSVLFISPERLSGDDSLLSALQTIQHLLAFIVLDEAHCMNQWGHDFRPSFHFIPMRIRALQSESFELKHGKIQWIALTATATVQVLDELQSVTKASKIIKYSLPRQNLVLHAHLLSMRCPRDIQAASMTFFDVSSTTQLFEILFVKVLDLLREEDSYPAIVYTSTQQRAEEFASLILRRQNEFFRDPTDTTLLFSQNFTRVAVYHAGLQPKQRSEIQKKFLAGKIEVIVATIAFGMGLNKKNIRRVIHLSLPSTPEQYVQEIGRGGRDGVQCHCHLVLHPAFYYEARRHIVKSICHIDTLNSICDYLLGTCRGRPNIEFAVDFLHLQQMTLVDEPTLVRIIRLIEHMAPEYIRIINTQNLSSKKRSQISGLAAGQTYRFANISFFKESKKQEKSILPDIAVRSTSHSFILDALENVSPVYNMIKLKGEKFKSFQLDIFVASDQCGMSYSDFLFELQSLECDKHISVSFTEPVCAVHQLQACEEVSRRLIARNVKFFLDEQSELSIQKLNCIFNVMNVLANGASSEDTHSTLESYFSQDSTKPIAGDETSYLQSLMKMPNEFIFALTPEEKASIQSIARRLSHERTHTEIIHVLYGIGPSMKENFLFGKFSHLSFKDVSRVVEEELNTFHMN